MIKYLIILMLLCAPVMADKYEDNYGKEIVCAKCMKKGILYVDSMSMTVCGRTTYLHQNCYSDNILENKLKKTGFGGE